MITEAEKQAAVDSYCSHICAQRPNLKLNPTHCERRREMAGRFTILGEITPGSECRECPGPIPRHPKPKEDPVQATAIEESPVKSRYRCRVCGDTDLTHFYSSISNLCKRHHIDRCKQRKRSHPDNVQLPPDPLPTATAIEGPEVPAEPPPDMRTCKVCGTQFSVYRRGTVFMKSMCHECVTKRVLDGVHRRPFTLPGKVPNVVLYFEGDDTQLLARISDEAKRNRRTVSNQVLFMIEEWCHA